MLGEYEAAIAELEYIHSEWNAYPPIIPQDPIWDPIRDDPRFQDLVSG